MRILTDCKERLADFVPARTAWAEREASLLDKSEQGLWRALAKGSVSWTAQIAVDKPSTFWRRVIVIEEAARSQFDVLHTALGDGLSLDGPTAVVALTGYGFRGQRDRPWSTIAGNLFLTVGLPVGAPAADLVGGLIMLPAVAVVDAVRACGSIEPGPVIKWVNDILIDGHKVAGVLAASRCRNGLLEAAVLGLGVNVVRTPAIEPTPFVPSAGCLKEAGIDVTLGRLVWCVLDKLAERYRSFIEEGPAGLLRSYREASCIVGRRVRVWGENADRVGVPDTTPPLAAGVVRSIEDDLSLRIDGYEGCVAGGRLALEEDCVALGL